MATKPRGSFDRKFIPLSTRFDHALLFAAQVHRNQDRKKSGIPYVSHLLGVASIVMDYGGDEEMAIAALLHDAVEDHGGRPMLKAIGQLFGARVAKIVDGCTDSYAEDPKKKEGWERRKLRYLHRIRSEDADTRFVSAADKLYNARAVLRDLRYDGDFAFARFSAPKAKTLWYYRALVREYRLAGMTHRLRPLIDDLDRAVTEVEHISGILGSPIRPPRRIGSRLKGKR
ncbi:MAG TPA: HD domain-containing protein [Candidatus Binatia bacterium]|nr:HD domain-containing protein [Candidatus Binatia bacterium]